MATIIYPSGKSERLQPAPGTNELSLQQLQEAVGGDIEAVTLANGMIMMVNENGKLEERPVNLAATLIANIPGGAIVGTVVIGTPEEMGYDDGE